MLSDLKLALRTFTRTPGIFVIAVVALGIGIGANTAMFSFFKKLIIDPLPFPSQRELLFIGEHSADVPNMSVSYPNFLDWRERQTAFTSIGVSRGQSFNFVGPTETERVPGAMVSHDLLVTLRVQPLRGRWFAASDDRTGAERTLIISERFWKRMFNGRDSAVGEKVNLSGSVYTIVGVMPAEFEYPNAASDLWVPVGLFADIYKERGSHPGLYAVARMKPGETIDGATLSMKQIAAQLAAEYPKTNTGNSVNVQMLVDRALGPSQIGIFVGLAAAFGVLMIACANVANLLLARAITRQKEFAVRSALGAGRARIVRQLLTESLMLGIAGCVAGVVAGQWMIAGMKTLIPPNLPRVAFVEVDGVVLLFSATLAIVTSLVFGLIPALTASRFDLNAVLARGGRSGGSPLGRWRSVLIAGEFALTLVLLVTAALFMRTLQNMYAADTGFSRERVLTWSWVMPGKAYEDSKLRVRLLDAALQKLSALPGAELAAVINPLPMSGSGSQESFYVEGTPVPGFGEMPATEYNTASPDYFAAMGIPLLRGRTFNENDRDGATRVLVIDTTFAEKHFPGVDPIGRRVLFGHPTDPDPVWFEIIGIVAHVQNYSLGQETRVQCYPNYAQEGPGGISFVLKTRTDPSVLAGAVRQAMREVDPALPVFNMRTMQEVFDFTVGYQRALLITIGFNSIVALVLAAVGIYGVLSFLVGQRTREIGIRMAVGATPESVLHLILKSGLKLAAIGLGVGLVIALGVTRFLETLLYDVSPFDPISLGAVVVLLLLIGAGACLSPARRATRVNPVDALRAE